MDVFFFAGLAALAGIVACTALALAIKPLNLGLFGNAATGGLVAGGLGMSLMTMELHPWAAIGLGVAAGLAAMTAIGTYLNARAR